MAGIKSATSVPIIAMTTSSSTSEKAATDRVRLTMRSSFGAARHPSCRPHRQQTAEQHRQGSGLRNRRDSYAGTRCGRLTPDHIVGNIHDAVRIAICAVALSNKLAIV